MKDYRPLLLQTIDVSLPGVKLLRLRLNRHLPAADRLELHSHTFTQILCYLSGGGVLVAGRNEYPVRSGSAALIPAGRRHGFRESGLTRPLCLALDLETERHPREIVAMLTGNETTRLRLDLSGLLRQHDPGAAAARLIAASRGLAMVDVLYRALGLLPREADLHPAFVRKFASLARDPLERGSSIAALAARTGFQRDYLNRRYKEMTGLTLSQERDAARLDLAKKSLAKGEPVGEAARQAGFDDANYFTRWFRRKQGIAPSRWRRVAAG